MIGTKLYDKDKQAINPISHAQVINSDANPSYTNVEDNLKGLWENYTGSPQLELEQGLGDSTVKTVSQYAITKALAGHLEGQKANETAFIVKYLEDNDTWDNLNQTLNSISETDQEDIDNINGCIRYYISGLRVDVINRIIDSSNGSNRRLTQIAMGNIAINSTDSKKIVFNGETERTYWRLYSKGSWSDWFFQDSGVIGIYPTTLDIRALSGQATKEQITELLKIKSEINNRKLCVLGTGTDGDNPETVIVTVTETGGGVDNPRVFHVRGLSTRGNIHYSTCQVSGSWANPTYGSWQSSIIDLAPKNAIGNNASSPMSQDATTKAIAGLLPEQKASETPFIIVYVQGSSVQEYWDEFNNKLSDPITSDDASKFNGNIRYFVSGLRIDVVNRIIDGNRRLTQTVTGNISIDSENKVIFNGDSEESYKRLFSDGSWGDWEPNNTTISNIQLFNQSNTAWDITQILNSLQKQQDLLEGDYVTPNINPNNLRTTILTGLYGTNQYDQVLNYLNSYIEYSELENTYKLWISFIQKDNYYRFSINIGPNANKWGDIKVSDFNKTIIGG